MKSKTWLALLALYIVWGSTYLAIYFVVQTIPPFISAAFRFLIAGVILFVWRRLAKDPLPTPRQWKSAAIVGLLLLLGGNGLVVWSEQLIPSGIAALLIATVPLWMVFIDSIRPGGSKPTIRSLIGLIAGFAGMIVLIGPAEFTGGSQQFNILGMIVCVLAALFWSIGSIYSRSADLSKSALMTTGMEMLTGSIGLFVAATITGEWQHLAISEISKQSIYGLLYLIFIGSLVGFVSYAWLLRNAPLPLVATYAYVNPLVAILLGALLANEQITTRVVIAGLIIIGSVIFINLLGKPTKIQEKETAGAVAE